MVAGSKHLQKLWDTLTGRFYICRSYSLWDSSEMASSNTTNLLFLMNLLVL